MEGLIKRIFFYRWQQKGVAFICAVVIWLLVSNSITTTKVLTGVPIRVVNIPSDKTIEGLLPNGLLRKRIALTLTGSKDTLDHLEASDIEVILDAANKNEEWIAKINRKNLASLNPEIDLLNGIDSVSYQDFVIKLTRLITAKIPIIISNPIGEPPNGYQFLDIWPSQLYHTITGPEDIVMDLQSKGIHLVFDLRRISKNNLDDLISGMQGIANDEINFPVPNRWKKICLPFVSEDPVEINDPNSQQLHITFLKQEFLPIERHLPIVVFYPQKYRKNINPKLYTLKTNEWVKEIDGVSQLVQNLYSHHVSRLFLDVIRDNIEIDLITIETEKGKEIQWSLEFINSPELENEYIHRLLTEKKPGYEIEAVNESESNLRNRFREYMQQFKLYTGTEEPLNLDVRYEGNSIIVEEKNKETDASDS